VSTKKTVKTTKTKGSKKTSNKSTSKKQRSVSRSEPKTMEDLLAKYGGGKSSFTQGQTVKGVVLEKLPRKVIIDIGAKSEGVVAEGAYELAEDYIKDLQVGDKVEAQVLVPESYEGSIILSLKLSAQRRAWKKMRDAKDKDLTKEVYGKSVTPSGVTVKAGSIFGFIPQSQLGREALRNPRSLIDKRISVKVVDVDEQANRLVLSEKAVSESVAFEAAKEVIRRVNVGEIYKGKVITVADFGCFVRLEVPLVTKKKSTSKKKIKVEGLVHVSELSWGRVDSPSEAVSVGDRVEVKVLGKKDNKLSLSIKQAKLNPWESAKDKYKKNSKWKGKIVRMSDFGVFVELEPGIEGLIHMTKIPPGTKLKRGQEIDVYVEDVDLRSQKLSLELVHITKPIGYK
jgi:ribosomal protein S1